VLIVLVIAGAIGWVHGWLIIRLGLQPFVVTLFGLLIYQGAARCHTQDGTGGFTVGQTVPSLEWVIAGRSPGVPHSTLAFAVIAVAARFVPHRTVFGRDLFAVGKNDQAARCSGIDTSRVIIAA